MGGKENRLDRENGYPIRQPDSEQEVHQLAEERARADEARLPEASSSKDDRKRSHELRVHQIELEMQNEGLLRTQAELEASRKRYMDLYDRAPVGYCTLDESGLILEANLTAVDLLGLDRSALQGRAMSGFVFHEDQSVYRSYSKQCSASGGPQACELRMMKEDGTQFWAQMESSVVKNSDGNPVCRVVFENCTERKQAEEEHKRLNERLCQLQKMEAVGRLAGGVAHDFNNMLQIMLGNTEIMLSSGNLDAVQAEHLKAIAEAGKRAAVFTSQLLAFARKEAVVPQVLDINHEIEVVISSLRQSLNEKIDLCWKPSADPCFVRIDSSQFSRILNSLIVNARDAITGEGLICIQTEKADVDEAYSSNSPDFMPSPYVLLSISDTGCGMDNEMINCIFEPFFTTKPSYLGCGLGLTSLYGIVRQNKGFIQVDSEVGKGTSFKIYLPRQTVKVIVRPEEHIYSGLPTGTETILLVDDEEALLVSFKHQLEDLGYKVLASTNPVEALNLTRSYKGDIHLLLTDVSMQKMPGTELSKRIVFLRPQIKFIFMSGYTSDILLCQQDIYDDGLNFLQKPFSIEELARKIRDVLSP